MQVYRLRGALALTAIVAAAACSDNLSVAQPTGFYANMSPDQEVPAIALAGATGTAVVTVYGPATTKSPGDSVHVKIDFSGLSGAATQAHIHVGSGTVAGPVRVNLCGTGAPAPACTASPIDVRAGAVIGITFDSLYSALKSGGAYVNIHTTTNAGGEIRGVINKDPLPTALITTSR
jgi:hypothetical protein